MKVLMITGDKKMLTPGTEAFARAELQRAQVEKLEIVFWGRGSLWPKIPRGSFDVITAQDPFWRGHLAWHLTWFIRAKLNIQVHTDLDAQPSLWRVFAGMQLRHADSVRVVSQKIKAQVENMGVHAPISVLPVYIDIERFKTVVRHMHITKTILWVGRFEQEKDPLYALSVLQKVRQAGIEANLVMLGTGSLSQQLKNRGRSLLAEFPGWQDPVAYLAKADVVLSTSRHESWGASIVEALAAGVPVVAPDVGIAREAGATVVPREELAEAVVDALHSGARGVLKLRLLSKEEWAVAWKNTL